MFIQKIKVLDFLDQLQKLVVRLTSMNVCMLLHVRLLMEPFPAVLAGVRPGVGVDKKVGREGAGPLEGLATLLALEDLLHAVDSPASRNYNEDDSVVPII